MVVCSVIQHTILVSIGIGCTVAGGIAMAYIHIFLASCRGQLLACWISLHAYDCSMIFQSIAEHCTMPNSLLLDNVVLQPSSICSVPLQSAESDWSVSAGMGLLKYTEDAIIKSNCTRKFGESVAVSASAKVVQS